MIEEMGCRSGSTKSGRGSVGQNTDVGNKFADVENGLFTCGSSGGSSQESLRTYKRRRHTTRNSSKHKVIEASNTAVDIFRQLPDKKLNESMDMVLRDGGSDDSHLNNSTKNVSNQLYQLPPESEGGLLVHFKDKASFRSPLLLEGMKDRSHKSAKRPLCVTSNGLKCKSSRSNTDLCQQAFQDIVKSEKYAQLRDLLLKNFEGEKVDNILDFSHINSSMKEGAYEMSPVLFHSDMQKVWEHLQKVGAELGSLAKSLMDMFKASYSQQFPESDLRTKVEQTEECADSKACTCRHCGEKAEGKDCLVCDSCEEMYHIPCIEPPVDEIPTKNWYCINCVAIGIGSCHDNCVVCEKLISILPVNVVDHQELSLEFEGESNGFHDHETELRKGGNNCNICKTEILSGKNVKVCDHAFCIHRYYHMNCLTNKQLSTHGPRWYCPSCLCRACLTDKDDHEIVMCDGCDGAYHIYCMQPPRTTIPEGSWFCMKCDVKIQKIAKAKMEYERIQSEVENSGEVGKRRVDEEVVGESGGMDMLLSAAIALK